MRTRGYARTKGIVHVWGMHELCVHTGGMRACVRYAGTRGMRTCVGYARMRVWGMRIRG